MLNAQKEYDEAYAHAIKVAERHIERGGSLGALERVIIRHSNRNDIEINPEAQGWVAGLLEVFEANNV